MGRRHVLLDRVPRWVLAPRPCPDTDHECRWVGQGGVGEDSPGRCGWPWRDVVYNLGREGGRACTRFEGRGGGGEEVTFASVLGRP